MINPSLWVTGYFSAGKSFKLKAKREPLNRWRTEREAKHILTVLWFYHLIYRRPAGQLRSVFHRPKSNKWHITLRDSPCKTRACLKTYTIMNKKVIPLNTGQNWTVKSSAKTAVLQAFIFAYYLRTTQHVYICWQQTVSLDFKLLPSSVCCMFSSG